MERDGLLAHLARGFALAGGGILLGMAGVTLASVVGRVGWARPLPGDFELVEIGCAVAVFAFLPYCQLRRGHAAVDLITRRAAPRLRARLDALSGLLMAAVAGLLAWRLAAGGMDFRRSGEESMILGLPLWWAFVPIVVSLVLLVAVALRGVGEDVSREGRPPQERDAP